MFVRRRNNTEIKLARSVDISGFPDPYARNANIDEDAKATDLNRTLDTKGEWLVMIGVCTHLGCIPLADAGDFSGWFCPCHGSHYDSSGRIRKGPAPENLAIPVATFLTDTTLRLGG